MKHFHSFSPACAVASAFAGRRGLVALSLGLALSGFLFGSAQAAPTLDHKTLREMDDEINLAIDEEKCPGGVLWVEHGKSRYFKAFGERALVPQAEEMTRDTIFDLASLTKV